MSGIGGKVMLRIIYEKHKNDISYKTELSPIISPS